MTRRRWRSVIEQRASLRARFRSEGALCDALAAKARGEGFVVHAETSGWDLLLVAPGGAQVGVQAKLRANVDVLAQALGSPYGTTGPDYHAVLVVDAPPPFRRLATELRVTIVDGARVVADAPLAEFVKRSPLWSHETAEWVPPIEIACVVGGRSGPVQITPWKIAALQLCRRLRKRGWVAKRDFTELSISPTYWVTGSKPLLRVEKKLGKVFRYHATGLAALPDERWPDIAAALDLHLGVLDERRNDDAPQTIVAGVSSSRR
jgi:hypothetical protein